MVFIRHEKSKDTKKIHFLLQQAFGRPDEADLVDTLRERGKFTLSMVAIHDTRVVGHILFSPVTVESKRGTRKAVGLAPLAVLPPYQRSGIGSKLVLAGLKECGRAGHEVVVVIGDPAYYRKFGFSPAKPLGLHCEFDVPDDVFMVMGLSEGFLTGTEGTVKYQPEFSAV